MRHELINLVVNAKNNCTKHQSTQLTDESIFSSLKIYHLRCQEKCFVEWQNCCPSTT